MFSRALSPPRTSSSAPLLTLSLALLCACGSGSARFADPQPVAVNATGTFSVTNSTIDCPNLIPVGCRSTHAQIQNVTLEPPGIFDFVNQEGSRFMLKANGAGRATAFVEATLEGRTLMGELEVEARQVASVSATLLGGFEVTRFVMEPSGTIEVGARVLDSNNEPLVTDGLVVFSDPSGALSIALQDASYQVTAPAMPGSARLVSITGEEVQVTISATAVPTRVEVRVPDARGDTVPVRVVGISDQDFFLFGDYPVTLEMLTPEVCNTDNTAFSFDQTNFLTLVAPGRCEVRARVDVNGQTLEATGSGRVAPTITRTQS